MTMTNFKRLVAFGCSHTAGHELCDHKILDMDWYEYHDWCRSVHWDKTLSDQEKIDTVRNRYWLDSQKQIERFEANAKASWSGKLAEKLQLPLLSLAKGGSSMSHIFFDIIDHLYYHGLNSNDLIVVGMTHVRRYVRFNTKIIGSFRTKNQFAESHHVKIRDLEHKNKGDLYNIEKLVWEYYNILKNIQQFGKENNLTILLFPVAGQQELDPTHKDWFCESQKMPIFKTYAKWCWQTLQQNIITPIGLEDVNGTRFRSGQYHFVEQTHQDYADHVYEKIIQRKIISP